MRRLKRLLQSIILCNAIFLVGCSSDKPPPPQVVPNATNLSQLQNLQSKTASKDSPESINKVRREGLKEVALSTGARAGLAERTKAINAMLESEQSYLDRIFNFNPLLLKHNIMPPILVEAKQTYNLAGPNVIRISDRQYKIEQQAHFVTTAPTWRQYLWLDFPPPSPPQPDLLPKNKAEKKVWKKYVTIGWEQGIQQGNSIFDENLGRLKRDYNGAILYRKLLAQHMVSAPYVAKTNLGVTGNSGELNINDQILRITALPQLNLKSQSWNPVIANEH